MTSAHLYIVGQTATGKTSFSLDLCEQEGFEILNTDSLLFYKNLNIGTAKPSSSELERVKHHLVDVCDNGEELTAADYMSKADKVLKRSETKFLCVGGSGFYVKALDVGLLPLPETDEKIREEVEKLKDPVSELKIHDPAFFEKISENDLYRVRRALQVVRQTGKPLSVWQSEFDAAPFANKMAFSIERSLLAKRIEQRTEQMVKEGLIEEVEELLKDERTKDWKPMSSVGYFQVVAYLNGEIKTLDEMKKEITLRTLQLSKRQKTWFKKDKSVTWFEHDDQAKAKEWVLTHFKENSWRA